MLVYFYINLMEKIKCVYKKDLPGILFWWELGVTVKEEKKTLPTSYF